MFRPAVVTQIGSVLKQAIITFTCKKDVFYQNLEILKSILDKTTAEDVNLNPQFLSDSLWNRPSKAPVTYIDIYEDNTISLGIFILKAGMKLPLHDHPQMYGLIKVIAGKIKVTSFSLNTEKTAKVDSNTEPKFSFNKVLTVEKCSEVIIDPSSDICTLEPYIGNLHEIESIGGPAAFIDILSPPYETEIENDGQRKCSYYKVTEEIIPSVYRVEEVHSPSWFWSDSFPYDGPEL